MVTDSPIFLGFAYSMDLQRKSKKDDKILVDILEKMLRINRPPRYDLIIHLPPVTVPIDDGTRPAEHLDTQWRATMDEFISSSLQKLLPPKKWVRAEGDTVGKRVKFSLKQIGALFDVDMEDKNVFGV